MKAYRAARSSALCLGLFLFATAVHAQTPTPGAEYTPTQGQLGKDVVWVPTAQGLVEKMLDLATVAPQDYLIDLGSGDGRLVIAAGKRGARALGIEYNPDMVELSKRNAAKAGVADKVQFVKADIFESDFSQATVITLFLLPDLNLKLRPQLLNLKPGTRVVSNTFTMEDWTPDGIATMPEPCSTHCTALFWIVPAKVDGEWTLSQGRLQFTQSFQTLSGTLVSGAQSAPVTAGRLRGDEISFTVGGIQYTGRVTGNAMQGVSTSGGTTSTWSAVRAN